MDDYEIEDGPCPHCGNPHLHFRSCDVIRCEDGFIDEYEDDPINYSPDEELRECEECHGTGIQRWCPACGRDVVLAAEQAHEFRPCPFCGDNHICEDDDFGGFFCRGCGYGFTYEGCDNELQRSAVRARWNTRPIEDALHAELEAQQAGITNLRAGLVFALGEINRLGERCYVLANDLEARAGRQEAVKDGRYVER